VSGQRFDLESYTIGTGPDLSVLIDHLMYYCGVGRHRLCRGAIPATTTSNALFCQCVCHRDGKGVFRERHVGLLARLRDKL
jgi:hypothetical protein